MKDRAIVRRDKYGSYEIWFPDQKENGHGMYGLFGAVPCCRVRRLRNHCHSTGHIGYYSAKTKMVKKPLAQAVLNLYETQFNCKGDHRLVMRWNRR